MEIARYFRNLNMESGKIVKIGYVPHLYLKNDKSSTCILDILDIIDILDIFAIVAKVA